jgi:hypothetical protein
MLETLTLDQLTAEQRKVLGHDLRYAIFMKLGERPRNATELEVDLKVCRKEISRQIRTLAKVKLVELTATPSGPRGGLLRKYRSRRHVFNQAEWDQMPKLVQHTLSARIAQTLIGEIVAALVSGSFDSSPNRVLTRRPVELDEEGAVKADEILTRADEEVAEVSAESLARGGKTRPWLSGIVSFPTAE